MLEDQWTIGLVVAVLIAAGISSWLAWSMARGILAEEPSHPRWLEAVMPLKGRWLALLLSTPVILLTLLTTFAIVGTSALLFIALLFWSVETAIFVTLLALGGLAYLGVVRQKSRRCRQPFK